MDLGQFWNDDFAYKFSQLLENVDLGLTSDSSDFVVVDGEEGDYGIIRYKDSSGEVVAIKIVHGGDDEELQITEYGKSIIFSKFREVFEVLLS